eukprot:6206911-Pleurochrysis_carterae.AAC.1
MCGLALWAHIRGNALKSARPCMRACAHIRRQPCAPARAGAGAGEILRVCAYACEGGRSRDMCWWRKGKVTDGTHNRERQLYEHVHT